MIIIIFLLHAPSLPLVLWPPAHSSGLLFLPLFVSCSFSKGSKLLRADTGHKIWSVCALRVLWTENSVDVAAFSAYFSYFYLFILTWEGSIEEREWTKCVHVIAQHSKTYMPTRWREVSIGPLVCALGANPSLSASDEVLPHRENFPVHKPNHSAVKFIVLIGLASSATWDCFAFHCFGCVVLFYFVCVCVCAPVHNVLFTVTDVSQ